MLRFFRYGLLAGLFMLAASPLLVGGKSAPRVNEEAVQAEFKAAIQRIRQHEPDQQDSPALQKYVIYDYLVVARFRRELDQKPSDELDTAINAFLEAHAGQPVAKNLRNDWLISLANRRKWDWFMPRATEVTTPALICDRLQGKIAGLADMPGASNAGAQAAAAVSSGAPANGQSATGGSGVAAGATAAASGGDANQANGARANDVQGAAGQRAAANQPQVGRASGVQGAAAQANSTAQGIANEALARWSLAQKQPQECDPVFAWLRQQGVVTPELAETRTRAALAADNAKLAREFVVDVPQDRSAPLLQWAQLLDSSKAALTSLASTPMVPVEPAALVGGFDHLARADSETALALLPKFLARPDMTPVTQAKLQRIAAMGAAYGRDSAAIAAFDLLPESSVDNDVREWRVRAALWAGDWQKTLAWIDSMPPTQLSQPRWRYWRARAVAATQGNEAAAPLYAELAELRDFYGYLAADRIHHGYDLNAKASFNDETLQKAMAAQPGLVRAHALFDCGLDDDAMLEWAVVFTASDNAVKLQAAHLAARWGWYSQSIVTLAQVGEFDDVRLRYPRPFTSAVADASKLTQVPADWILAVMRQESLFRDDAVSRAGARGLMQMTPSTAIAVAKRWHLPVPDKDGSFDPPMDVQRGAAHLRDLLDKYGQLGLTLAAYNAGAIPVARWAPTRSMDADVWIENIPYGETRNYVQRIVEHIVAFAWVRDAEPPRLATLLPTIEPTNISAQSQPTAQ
ncbi:MAG TPA: transglycosylase SLT domain-containing protein [Steroidobacteraceae bacterium]